MEEKDDSIFGDLEDQCTCWVCFELFKEPITLHCAHTFCKECALKVQKKNPCCPFCRRPFDLPLPAVNLEISTLVSKYIAKLEGKDVAMRTEPVLEQNSFFLQLPREMVLEILAFLPPKEIGRASRISRDIRNLSGDSFMWRTICLRSFPFCSVDKYGKNWKHCYISRSNITKGWEGGKAGDFEVISLRGHQNYVNCFGLYRNNIVSGSADNNLKIWKTDSSDPIHTLVGHNGLINSVEFNETKIVSSSADSTVKVWDTKLGVPIQTIQHGAVNCAKFDDTKIVAGNNAQVKVYDTRDFSNTLTLTGHWNTVQQVQFDNNYIVSSSQDSVRVWDVRNGNSVSTFQGAPSHIAMAQANKIIVSQTTGEIGVLDAVSGHYTAFGGARHYQTIHDLKTDGKNVVSACADGTVKLWDLPTMQLVNTLSEHKGPVHTVQLSETKIVTGGSDNSIKVWDIKKGNRLYTLLGGSLQQRSNNPNHPTKPGCSHLEIDESRIVASFASLVRIYDFEIYRP